MKTIRLFITTAFLISFCTLYAQIGYQVSLLNSATGEPRANETVTVEVEISNSENTVICSETKSATTNDFGVLSLKVGTNSTFENVDWSKLPLYVSATVDGIMIGRSQILNVPVAEAAKTLVGISPDVLCRTWTFSAGRSRSYTFSEDGHCTYREILDGVVYPESGTYVVQGCVVYVMLDDNFTLPLIYYNNTLREIGNDDIFR